MNKLEKIQTKNEKNEKDIIYNFRRILWLHDANNYFIETITQNYLMKIPERKNKQIPQQKKKKEKSIQNFPLLGHIASIGNFKGKAKVINFLDGFQNISEKEILVTKQTTPNLIIAIVKCKGIITEEGGLTSHAAIISREIHKPCIVGVPDCTKVIKNGDYLVVKNGIINKK
jgi:phosphoenolpyruvate synthase/pyruvate phosphate dikinase